MIAATLETMKALQEYGKALQEYGRLCMVYMSFAGFLVAEVALIYWMYSYFGMI